MKNNDKNNDKFNIIPKISKIGNLEFLVVNRLPDDFNGRNFNNISEELIQALQLTYKVYVTEKEYIPKKNIPKEQFDNKMLWNRFDFLETTHQIVGVVNGEVVSRFRLSDRECPLNKNFNFTPYSDKPIRESSRFIILPEHRGTTTFKNLAAYQYHVSKDLGQVFWTGLEDTTPLYERAGADTLGFYTYTDFPGHKKKASIQRWDLDNLHLKHETNEKASQNFINKIMSTPIEILKE